jgi:hypothetical protein
VEASRGTRCLDQNSGNSLPLLSIITSFPKMHLHSETSLRAGGNVENHPLCGKSKSLPNLDTSEQEDDLIKCNNERTPNSRRVMMHQPQAIGIKRGFKATRTPTVCGVSFEALPVWLWALRLKEWIHIYITESDERQIHQAHPQLRSLLGQRLVTVEDPPHHDPRCTLAEVWWVSGSEAYVKGLTLPESVAQVIWVSNVGRRLPSSLEALADWQSISHARVGGVTNARGWFGFMGLDTISIPTDSATNLGSCAQALNPGATLRG